MQTVESEGSFGLQEFLTKAHEATFPDDPTFDRYCNLDNLTRAVAKMDSALATDVALQLAHGESILLRPRHGLTAAEAFDVAFQLASTAGDAASLERLKKAATKSGDKELVAKWEAQSKLKAASRSEETTLVVSPDEFSVEQYEAAYAISSSIRAAAAVGDVQRGAEIVAAIAQEPELTDSQKQRLIAYCRANAPTELQTPAAAVLKRLSQAARSAELDGSWDTEYQTADGGVVQASVEIQGNQGTYTVPGCQGRLYDIRSSAPLGGGATVVTGNWRFCTGETGTFRWSIDGDSFRGNWAFTSGGPRPFWNGVRSGGSFGEGDDGEDLGSFSGDGDVPSGDGELPSGDGDFASGDGDVPSDDGDLASGDGDGLDAFLGETLEADNGSTIEFRNNGTTMLCNRAGMRLPGRVVRRNDGTTTLSFGQKWASVQILNRNQIKVGPTVFTLR